MKVNQLLKGLNLRIDPSISKKDIRHVTFDSNDVKKGSLFIAIDGTNFDGHKFLEDAFQKGAVASLADKKHIGLVKDRRIMKVKDTRKALSLVARNFYNAPSKKLKVLGITGTNGKTTVSLLLENIFRKGNIPCGVIGTIEYKVGKKRFPASRTTPGALCINRLLSDMVKNKLEAAIMEVSSHALDQKRVDDILFDAAIFTNLTHEHLDYHKSIDNYFNSKARIFSSLKKKGLAIVNADCKYAIRAGKHIKHKLTYGLSKDAFVGAKIKDLALNGSSFLVTIGGKEAFQVNSRLVGIHNISNMLAAVAASISQDLGLAAIREGLESTVTVAGRLESVEMGQPFKVLVDYAHTHNALENVLRFLNQIKEEKILTVFGCGGERDRKKRPLMGRVAQKLSDFVVVTSDNPRGEDPDKIIKDIEVGLDRKKNNYEVIIDRKKAIEAALKKAKKGDIVLLAGKGHEKTQIIGDKEIPFDDKSVAEEILKKCV